MQGVLRASERPGTAVTRLSYETGGMMMFLTGVLTLGLICHNRAASQLESADQRAWWPCLVAHLWQP